MSNRIKNRLAIPISAIKKYGGAIQYAKKNGWNTEKNDISGKIPLSDEELNHCLEILKLENGSTF